MMWKHAIACVSKHLTTKVADASLYPVLFRDYLVTLWPEIGSGVAGQAFIAALTICIAGLNYVGLSIVGWVVSWTHLFSPDEAVLVCRAHDFQLSSHALRLVRPSPLQAFSETVTLMKRFPQGLHKPVFYTMTKCRICPIPLRLHHCGRSSAGGTIEANGLPASSLHYLPEAWRRNKGSFQDQLYSNHVT